MSFELFKDAVLTTDLLEHDLRAGDVGTIVERHVIPGKEDGYSVEFFDMKGRTIAVVTLAASRLRAPREGEIPAVRVRRSA